MDIIPFVLLTAAAVIVGGIGGYFMYHWVNRR